MSVDIGSIAPWHGRKVIAVESNDERHPPQGTSETKAVGDRAEMGVDDIKF